jgi:DNA-binding SARP family transcriptional activator
VQFRVLGPLEVVDGDRRLRLGGPRQRSVLALLLLASNRVVAIGQISQQMWGDRPPARSAGTLQAYVWHLRRALEPDRPAGAAPQYLRTRPPGYQLTVSTDELDLLQFDRLVREARAERASGNRALAVQRYAEALALWRGPLLADLPDLANDDRLRLHAIRMDVCEEHAELLLDLGRHGEALGALGKAVEEEPLRERLRGLHMVALARVGRSQEALASFADLRRRMAEEQGLDPGRELQLVQSQILRDDPVLTSVPSDGEDASHRSRLVGRAAEMDGLVTHLTEAGRGSGRVVLIAGEAGIGKTRLAEELANRAEGDGFRVVWGRAVESEAAPPLWLWHQIVDGLLGAPSLANAIDDIVAADPSVARARLGQWVARLIREACVDRPLLLVVDDLHWADEASLALLSFVAADLIAQPVLLLGTYRGSDVDQTPHLADLLGRLARLPRAGRLSLTGLAAAEVAELIGLHRRAVVPAEAVAAVHARTGGNPFFVTELLRLPDGTDLVSGPVPITVRDIIRRRFGQLPPSARTVLGGAALVGDEFDLGLVAVVVDLPPESALEAAEAGRAAGLLQAGGEAPARYRFTHALVREAVVAELANVARARLHSRIADVLADSDERDAEQVDAIAEHLWSARPLGDPHRTVREQVRAADGAWRSLAYERAERLLVRASWLLHTLPEAEVPIELELDVRVRLASLRSARDGYTVDVRAAFDQIRGQAARHGRAFDLLTALGGLSATAVVRGDLTLAGELTDAALEQARQLGTPEALAGAEQGVGIVAFYRGQLVPARERFAAALAAWAEHDLARPLLRGPPAGSRPDLMAPSYDALAACLLGDDDGAERAIQRALASATGSGEPYAVAFAHSFEARLAVLRGRPDQAERAAATAYEVAERHGFPVLIGHAAIPLGWSRAVGDPAAGIALVEAGLARLHRAGYRILTPFHRGLQAEVLRRLGDPASALRLVEDALAESLARQGGFEVPRLRRLRAELSAELGS